MSLGTFVRLGRCSAAVLLFPLAACSGQSTSAKQAASGAPPADVAGDYTVTLVTGDNDCPISWTPGTESKPIAFNIEQTGSKLTAEAQGDAAVTLVLLTGGNDFTGQVDGDAFTLTDVGPLENNDGNCNFTVNAIVEGTIDGDTISGTLRYEPVIGDDPDCDKWACSADETFTGTRPPS